IYRRVIENFFQAAEILKEEILGRLTEALFPKWSETLLLFFSLNKAATTDILRNLQREVGEDSEEDEYFHILVMKMLDSEEYGIKDSDLGYWTRVCVQYIARADRLNERSADKKNNSTNKGFELVRQYFLSEDRKGRLQTTRAALHEFFDLYFQSIQEGEYDVQEGRCLENVLYFISSPPVLDNSFQDKIEKAVPVLLNRERYGLQFLVAMELFVESFDEIADFIASMYTIDEAMNCKNFLGKSIDHSLTQERSGKYWLNVLFRWEMLLENLSVFFFSEKLCQANTFSKYNLKTQQYKKSASQLQSRYKLYTLFWENNCYSNVLNWLIGKTLDRSTLSYGRLIGLRAIHWGERKNLNIALWFSESIFPDDSIFGKNLESIKKITRMLTREEVDILSRPLIILFSSIAFLYSDIEHDQYGNRYDYLWNTYEELQHIYTLLQNSEALYAHLEKTTTSLIDKPTFLEQYKEYDQKPYSMRHMAKTVLDRGKENYPDSDN
ncbi:MAG: hypothetical protein D3925_02995, partial [Candidatus Electrothrix sp. AR5]|nr:hypothetical protein [Candidatus Electrothrix sp. AR5]